jgi:hypothetical protein
MSGPRFPAASYPAMAHANLVSAEVDRETAAVWAIVDHADNPMALRRYAARSVSLYGVVCQVEDLYNRPILFALRRRRSEHGSA